MRPVPLILLQTGEPALPLTVLKPIWAETHHKVNGIPGAKIVLSVEGNALETLPSCDEDVALCQPASQAGPRQFCWWKMVWRPVFFAV
jgi:type VI secretion system secreted protein VgrG